MPQPTWLGIGKREARLVRSLGDCSPRWCSKVRRAFENILDTPRWHSGPQSAEGAIPLGEIRPQSLMQLAAKLSHALAELDADLRARGFGQNCRGLAGELYASFTATIIATRGTEAEATAWTIGHALAIDLYKSGKRRGALALLEGLIELSASQGHPQILARLTSAAEAIEQTMGRRRRAAARTDKVADGPSAAAISPVQGSPAQDVGEELAGPAQESEPPTPIFVAPPPDPLAPRRRSRRGGVLIAAAATALVGIGLYVLVTYDGNLIRHSPSSLTSAPASPSNASLAKASTFKTPTAVTHGSRQPRRALQRRGPRAAPLRMRRRSRRPRARVSSSYPRKSATPRRGGIS